MHTLDTHNKSTQLQINRIPNVKSDIYKIYKHVIENNYDEVLTKKITGSSLRHNYE